MEYSANSERYNGMIYRRCGKSGIKLPAISLGLWHNFGGVDVFENGRQIILKAFDKGITHIDLANNYGPPAGSAEETFGKILKKDLKAYRDELIISTKGRLLYVAWAIRRMGFKKIFGFKPRSEPEKDEPRLCRYFLFASSRSGNTNGRNHGSA